MESDEIKILLKKLLSDFDYDRSILFGSRARGDFSERSDYDILVIMKEPLTIQEKMGLSTFLRKELAKKGIDTDIIIKSKEEVDYYKGKIGSVVKDAVKEGVVL